MTVEQFRELVLSFPGTEENPHFDRAAFKIVKKRIFATLHEASMTVNMKLSNDEQKGFCKLDRKNVYPVPNKWGLNGWTTFDISKTEPEVVQAALEAAYDDVLKSKGNAR